jgi:hypothetical protein
MISEMDYKLDMDRKLPTRLDIAWTGEFSKTENFVLWDTTGRLLFSCSLQASEAAALRHGQAGRTPHPSL